MRPAHTSCISIADSTRVKTRARSSASRRERVDHRGEHPHVVGGDAVHALGAVGDAAEDVAAAADHRDLEAQVVDFLDLGRDVVGEVAVDAEGLGSEKRLARELEQDALVGEGLLAGGHQSSEAQ